MRDPKRIPAMLQAIEELWRSNPDLRIGQILVAAVNLGGTKVVAPEIFFAEDEVVIKGLAEYQKKLASKSSTPNA